jgi:ATP-binding cassette, subfamily B, bacterial
MASDPASVTGLIVLTLLAGLVPAASAWSAKQFVDTAVGGGAVADLMPVGAAVGGALVAGYVLPELSNYLMRRLARTMAFEVNRKLFEKINADPGLARLERPDYQDRIAFACHAGEMAPQQLLAAALATGRSTVSAAGLIAIITAVDPAVGLIALAGAGPLLVAELHLSRRRIKVMETRTALDRRRGFYQALLQQPRAAKEIRLFGLGSFFHHRMLSDLRTGNALEEALDRTTLRVQTLLAGLAGLLALACIALAVRAALAGRLTAGELTAFLTAFTGLTAAVAGTVNQTMHLREGAVLLGRFQEFLTEPDPHPTRPVISAVPQLRRGITVEGVWFRYADDLPWVLLGVNLAIPTGGSIALVGLNGAGKSTLVKLLCRLYEPTWGRICWDGIDIRDLEPAALRQRIAAVFQDYMCYDLTAHENVGLGDLGRMSDLLAVQRAAWVAGVHDELARLPAGYNTMLSRVLWSTVDEPDRQANAALSGGQWQRVALARMFLRGDRDLVILDEPSAGLDAAAEHMIHQTVHQNLRGRARLLISHRLAAVRAADTIYVLDDGQIVEAGSHAALMSSRGRYAELFTLQASGYQDDRVGSSPG